MADNISTSAGTFASDDIGGVHYERLKLVLGADGVNDGDVHSSNPMPTTLVSSMVSIGGGTQYVDGNTSTAPTGTVMMWKSAVSTLVPGSTSNPLPVQGFGNLSSIATQLTLGNVSTFTNSTNTLLVNMSSNTASSIALESTIAQRLTLVSSLGLQATLAQVTTYTKSTADMLGGALASTGALWVQSIPGSAQTTISTTDLIRVAVYNATDGQVTNFGSGTQYVDGNTSTLPTGTVMLWKSAVSTLVPPSSSQPLPMNLVSSMVSVGGGTQYVEGNTTTAPTGNVLIWKSAVSTMSAASTSNPLPVHFISTSVSIGGGTQYVDGNTTTLPTGTVMLWKSAVSTIVPASTSNPFPVSSLPLTANLGTISSVATQATLAEVTTYTASSVSLLSTVASRVTLVSSLATEVTAANISTYTASSVSLLSTNTLQQSTRLNNISTFTNSTNTLLVTVSSLNASSNALVSTQGVTLGNISTYTNSTNTLLVQVSSLLRPQPTGIYVQPVGVSSNGILPYLTLDCNNSTKQIVSTAATIYGIYFGNTSSTPAYLKIWDGVSSATFVSSTAATMCLPIPANSTNLVAGNFTAGNGIGIKMSTGICIAGVAGANNGNSTAIGISSLVVNVFYQA